MSGLFGRIKVLSKVEMGLLQQAALDILERAGMIVHHAESRRMLEALGCKVDHAGERVRFPQAVVQEAVQRLRGDYLRPERQGLRQGNRYTESSYYRRDEELNLNFTANSGGFCTLVYDLERNRRAATRQDLLDGLKLVNALDDITHSGLPCSDQAVPAPLRPVKMAAELAKYTTKLGGIEAWTVTDVRFIKEIAVVVRGDEASLRARPCLVGYAESRSPLALDGNMADVFIEYIRQGLPQSIDTMPCAGTTTPATGAGTLAVGLAETLGGLVLGYAVDREAVLSLDFCGSYCDMNTLLFQLAGADRLPMLGAWIQFLKEMYGISVGVHGGKTDACEPGFQAGMQKAASALIPLLCGATGIGTVGQVEGCLTYSPLQLVLDADMVRYLRRVLAGLTVTEESLAVDQTLMVGPEGNFIGEPHTAANFRKEFWLSELTECLSWEVYKDRPTRGMERLAEEKVRAIIARPLEPVLDDNQITEIDRIVRHAEKAILG